MLSGPQFLASEIIEKNKVVFQNKNTFKRANKQIPTQSIRLDPQKKIPISITIFFQAEIMSLK